MTSCKAGAVRNQHPYLRVTSFYFCLSSINMKLLNFWLMRLVDMTPLYQSQEPEMSFFKM
jgi:hypothetical protein